MRKKEEPGAPPLRLSKNPIVGAGAYDGMFFKVTDSPDQIKKSSVYRRGVEGAAPYIA